MNFLFFIFWVTASSADPIVKTALARPFQFHPQHFAPCPTHKYSIPLSLSYLFPTKTSIKLVQEGISHDHFQFNSLIGPFYFLVGKMS